MENTSEQFDKLSHDLFGTEGNGKKALKEIYSEEKSDSTVPESLTTSSDNSVFSTLKIKPDLSENAIRVLEKRYLKKNEKGEPIETPENLFRRVSEFIASADKLYDPESNAKKTEEVFYGMMARLEFMPNSPTLMNAGRELGQLSACFVLPVEDSMDSIFEAVKNTALIHKSGGGTGFSFSRIRPKNDIVRSTHGIASGPISFMNVFDVATETVKQGGTRRGANMAILRVDHPDIEDFIYAKENNDHLNNFNISVALTEKFWDALETGGDYDLINPHSGKKCGSLNAQQIFDKIVKHAWQNGDPGVVFIDKLNAGNPTPELGLYESTNPCGEQPLLPFESCNLGSINLSKMIKTVGSKKEIDFDKLRTTVHNSVHFLDNVIDMNKYPLPSIEKQTRSTRKIGLGVMGFSDMLMDLEIPYNSQQGINIAEKVMEFINVEAKLKSQQIAKVRGEFPAFKNSVYDKRSEPKIRNATRTTIAPTGTISIIAGCSSGIEPLFALSFYRNVMDNDKLPELHPLFVEKMKAYGLYTDELIQKVTKDGTASHIDSIPEDLKAVFNTSHEISPEWHIRMQAAFQRNTDNAVSKTVNFANEATIDDVATVYRLAHDLNCKGVTIYRDGSRDIQVLNKGTGKNEAAEPKKEIVPKGRPRMLQGATFKLNTGQGSLYVTINMNESDKPVEVFANIGKSGGDTAALSEAIGRLISIALQNDISVKDLGHTLIGITGSRPVWNEGTLVKSVPDGIGQILVNHFGNESSAELIKKPLAIEAETKHKEHSVKKGTQTFNGPECPDCGSAMETSEGCTICRQCGYSHCG